MRLRSATATVLGLTALAGANAAGAGAATSPPPTATRVLRLVDHSRLQRPRVGRPGPRLIETVLRYPAPPAHGPFPLIVFAHGFDVTPATYSRLLRYWAQAGFAVAAPVFPLERAGAPGGPDESDLVNEPGDMSFVTGWLLGESAKPGGALAGLVDAARIAVAGQSDGGVAALAAAFGRRLRDPRFRAAVILSGSEWSGIGGYAFRDGEAPLLAVQGTADTSNQPRYTYAYFRSARRPKYLLRLIGAAHLPPYTYEQPQLGIVERLSTTFLRAYLGLEPAAAAALETLGGLPLPAPAELLSEP